MAGSTNAIEIDASINDGGGQMLRRWLALSLITGHVPGIENIRARHRRPSLMHNI